MVYIITRKGKKFSEKYLWPGGIEAAEKDGISKSTMMTEINHLTDKGVSIDQRRDIVNNFVDREKGK
jgi:predicted transcriptional regulator